MSIYYHCYRCSHEWIGDLQCPTCGNRELKGPTRIDGGDKPDNIIEVAEEIAHDAVCTCDDVYGDNPWCKACVS